MNFLHMLLQGATHPNVPQGLQHAASSLPDITYNPNPNTNIPFSTHQLPQAMHQLQQMIHGPIGQQHGMASNYSTPIQGMQNPGFTPMQGSRGVMPMQGGMHQVPFQPQGNNFNPQQNIQLY